MLSQTIGDILPLAFGVALSPMPIIAVILMLATPRARSNGAAFAAGWMLGLLAVSGIVLVLAGAGESSDGPGTAGSIARIVLGLALFGLAAKQWRSRPAEGEEAPMPAWMATIDEFTSGRSLLLGAALSGPNPKNLALAAAAGATIADGGLSNSQSAIAVAAFVVLASVTVAGPVLFFLVAGDTASGPLAAVKSFMADNVAAIMMVLFIVLGARVLGSGFAGLNT